MEEVCLTVLVENTVERRGLLAEHGFAVLVEADGKKILFDTGAGRAILSNMENLGINIKEIDLLVLSHGHYDHTGGIKNILNIRDTLDIYAHPDIFCKRYNVKDKRKPQYTGIPWTKKELEDLGAKFHLSTNARRITANIMTTGFVPRLNDFENVPDYFQRLSQADYEKDIIADDQALIISSTKGLIVLLGCAHSGVINTLHHVQKLTGKSKIYAILGGTHLKEAEEKRITSTLKVLDELKIERIGVGHCTGFQASAVIYQAFKKEFFSLPVGTKICL